MNAPVPNMPIYQALTEAFAADDVDTHFTLMGDGNMHWATAMKNLPGMSTINPTKNRQVRPGHGKM